MLERHVTIRPPFDLRATVRALGVGHVDGHGTWWWALPDERGGASTIAVSRADGGADVRAWGPDADSLADRASTILGVGEEPPDAFAGTPAAPFLSRSAGLRIGATGDVHGALAKGILGQVVTRTEARASLRHLAARFGPRAPGPNESLRSLPPPALVAQLSYEDLHAAGIERRRADILIEASRRARRLSEIVGMPPADARRRLLAVRGIGPWTAAIVLGTALGDRDAVPVGDYHLPNTVAWALAGEERGSDERMLDLLEPYRPVRRRVLVALVQAGVRAPRRGPRTPIRTHL